MYDFNTETDNLTFGKIDNLNSWDPESKSKIMEQEYCLNKKLIKEMSLERITEKDETLNQQIYTTDNDFSAQMEGIEEISNQNSNSKMNYRSTNNKEVFNRSHSDNLSMNAQGYHDYSVRERNINSNKKSVSPLIDRYANSNGRSSNKTHEITQIQQYIEDNKLENKDSEEWNSSEYESRLFNDSWGSIDSIPLMTQALRATKENRNSIYTKLSKDREGRVQAVKVSQHFIAEESSINPGSSFRSYDQEFVVNEEFVSVNSNRSN